MKKIVLEYKEPYKITQEETNIIISKNWYPLIQIENPEFVIQIGENDFVFTESDKDINKERDVIFKHIAIEEKRNIIVYEEQSRRIKANEEFSLIRLGQKFLIPSDEFNHNDNIYDAKSHFLLTEILRAYGTFKAKKITINDQEYFKIFHQIIIAENELGDAIYEQFTALLNEEESKPSFAYSSLRNEVIPLQAQGKYNDPKNYLKQLQKEYSDKQELQLKLLVKLNK